VLHPGNTAAGSLERPGVLELAAGVAPTCLFEVAVVDVGVHPEQALEYGAHRFLEAGGKRLTKLCREDALVVNLQQGLAAGACQTERGRRDAAKRQSAKVSRWGQGAVGAGAAAGCHSPKQRSRTHLVLYPVKQFVNVLWG